MLTVEMYLGHILSVTLNIIAKPGYPYIRLCLWCLTPRSTICQLYHGDNKRTQRKPPTYRKLLTLSHNIVLSTCIHTRVCKCICGLKKMH